MGREVFHSAAFMYSPPRTNFLENASSSAAACVGDVPIFSEAVKGSIARSA